MCDRRQSKFEGGWFRTYSPHMNNCRSEYFVARAREYAQRVDRRLCGGNITARIRAAILSVLTGTSSPVTIQTSKRCPVTNRQQTENCERTKMFAKYSARLTD